MRMILFALLFALIGIVPVLAQPLTTANYLQQNHRRFLPADSTSYALYDSAFYQNDVFLLGETHGYALPQTLDLALLKHLLVKMGGLTGTKPDNEHTVTTDYFQYVFVVLDSPAVSLWPATAPTA
jgi:hypothetical protein